MVSMMVASTDCSPCSPSGPSFRGMQGTLPRRLRSDDLHLVLCILPCNHRYRLPAVPSSARRATPPPFHHLIFGPRQCAFVRWSVDAEVDLHPKPLSPEDCNE